MAFSKPRPANVICEPLPYYTGKESGDYFLKCYDGVLNHQVFNTANQAWHTESELAGGLKSHYRISENFSSPLLLILFE